MIHHPSHCEPKGRGNPATLSLRASRHSRVGGNLLKFAVIGNPIAHSLSPQIHQNFAAQFNINLEYKRILSTPENFHNDVLKFFAEGGCGLNITSPFKILAHQISDHKSTRSIESQSANTLWVKDQKIYSDSTDGIGLVKDLAKYINLTNKKILILGAGGATSSIIPALLPFVSNLTIFTRRSAIHPCHCEPEGRGNPAFHPCHCRPKGGNPVFHPRHCEPEGRGNPAFHPCHCRPKGGNPVFHPRHCEPEGRGNPASFKKIKITNYHHDQTNNYDIIINATTQLDDELLSIIEKIIITNNPICYDLTYHCKTPFLQIAESYGCSAIDGLGMLQEQAAESFYIWHNKLPKVSS